MRKMVLFSLFLACVFFVTTETLEAKNVLIKINSLSRGQFEPGSGEKNEVLFTVIKEATVKIHIFNSAKKEILGKDLSLVAFTPGQYSFIWDGADQQGKVANPGFYNYELEAYTSDNKTIDKDNAPIEVQRTKMGKTEEDLPPAIYDEGVSSGMPLTMGLKGYISSGTSFDTGGANYNREEIYLNLNGGVGPQWIYNLEFFPSYINNQSFKPENILYTALIGYRDFWGSIDGGYRNYVEGYYDPLNLLASYKMGSSRMSVMAKTNFIPQLFLRAGYHQLFDLNGTGLDLRGTYDIIDGFRVGGFLINNASSRYVNRVFAGDIFVDFERLNLLRGTNVVVEFAGSTQENTNPILGIAAIAGSAIRLEANHQLLFIPENYGITTVGFNWEYITPQFVADFADLPNGVDNTGIELLLDYLNVYNLILLKNFHSNTKFSFMNNIEEAPRQIYNYYGPPIVTKKFKALQSISFALVDNINLMMQYEYSSRIDSAPPPPVETKNINASVQMNYISPNRKFDLSVRYSDSFYIDNSDTDNNSSIDLSATRVQTGYHFSEKIGSYIGYERTVGSYRVIPVSNTLYNHYFLGLNWIILPKFRTEVAIQSGYAQNMLTVPESGWATYYFKLQHYLLDRLKLMGTIGSLSYANVPFQFYIEMKYEF